MKRRLIVGGIVVIVVVVAALIFGFSSLNFGAAPAPQTQQTAPAQQTVTVRRGSLVVTVAATGKVSAAQDASLSFPGSGIVTQVNVHIGDMVKAGQVLMRVDDTLLQGQLRQSQSALKAAQANYALLKAGPTDEQLRQAQAALMAATAAYSRTVSAGRPSAIASAQAALAAAFDAYAKLKAGPQPVDYAAAEAAYRNAQAALQQAQAAYDSAYKQNPAAIGASQEALALQQATNNFNAAKAAYDKASQRPDAALFAASYQQVQSARAALDVAVNPARDFDIVQAQAQVDQARAALDALKGGARPQQLEAAQAQVDAAQASVDQVQSKLNESRILAPFDGTIAAVNYGVGNSVGTGPAVEVVNLNTLQVNTILSKMDAPKVKAGNLAQMTLEELPGKTYTATLMNVGPVPVGATPGTLPSGVVNYPVIFDIANPDSAIKPGMTAKLNVQVDRRDQVLLVPSSAVQLLGAGKFVTVLANSQRIQTPITAGLSNDQWTEVTGGLKEGDVVMLNP